MPQSSQPDTIDDYIAGVPAEVQPVLQDLRQQISQHVPDATEAIHYGMPAFMRGGTYVVYFAAWQNHIALYPVPTGDPALDTLIKPFVRSKSSLHFPLDQPLPMSVIKRVVEQLGRLNHARIS